MPRIQLNFITFLLQYKAAGIPSTLLAVLLRILEAITNKGDSTVINEWPESQFSKDFQE